ncbi:MAG: hypothetical protein Q4G59_04515 [Planctomycetia bacterium]|nr:hypothetical protein [Planctomycetia bacterium]
MKTALCGMRTEKSEAIADATLLALAVPVFTGTHTMQLTIA